MIDHTRSGESCGLPKKRPDLPLLPAHANQEWKAMFGIPMQHSPLPIQALMRPGGYPS